MLKNKNLLMYVMLFIFAAAMPMMALNNGSTNFRVSEKLFVAGSELQAGDYDVKWEPTNQGVTVSFSVKGKTIATVQGKVVGKESKSEHNSMLVMTEPANRRILKEIRLSGKSDVIVFE